MARDDEDAIKYALKQEGLLFEKCYRWLERHMPKTFFEECSFSKRMTIAHNLMGLHLQRKFIEIHFRKFSIVLCEDSLRSDMQILQHFNFVGIKSYQTFISDEPPPLPGIDANLRIAMIHFTEAEMGKPKESGKTVDIFEEIRSRNPELTRERFDFLLSSLPAELLHSLPTETLSLLFDMFYRATTRDYIQYECKMNKNWNGAKEKLPSMQIVLAWKNTPKANFLYRLAKMLFRHDVTMQKVSAGYVKLPSSESVLLMSLELHGKSDRAVWEVTNVQDMLQELATLKYFEDGDVIETVFVTPSLIRGNLANFLRMLRDLSHQFLLHHDANEYSLIHIEEALCRHPELSIRLLDAFEQKFHPIRRDFSLYETTKTETLRLLEKLDTGNVVIDTRRKNVLKTCLFLIDNTLKTNFYRNNKSALAVRLAPDILRALPYNTETVFPEIPFAIFFFKGKSFIGFHVRFRDLSRGGLRTVLPSRIEQARWERSNIFHECYQLAFTQQKKNKDIPEGGAKGIIFIEAFEEIGTETEIYRRELQNSEFSEDEIEEKTTAFHKEQRLIYLYQSQRSYVYSLLTLVNCDDAGVLKARDIVDYYKKPEYLYLGPDENMHNVMIEWIADHAERTGYKPLKAFISSKPTYGINHKEYGVTSLTVNTYMHEVLLFLGIDPYKAPFTVKISGGPDGDVAGNQIYNLYKHYPHTAKLIAVTDISGTVFDPGGLDLKEMVSLFKTGKPLSHYPTRKLSDGGFLLDLEKKKEEVPYTQLTLCTRKEKGLLHEEWLSGSDTHYLFSHNLHQTATDIFIPAGGRPRTLNLGNWKDFLDASGEPTSKAIIEGANLYLTPEARRALETKGVLIIKDSSANKGGVICSSLEVLSGLILTDAEFLKYKTTFMPEILDFIRIKAEDEARLLLHTYLATKKPLTQISDELSEKINDLMYRILSGLEPVTLSSDPNDPLNRCLFLYNLPFFRTHFEGRILTHIPDIHKKAMISSYIAANLIYKRGLDWTPSILDILPHIISDLTTKLL
ncbi:MAG: glutamate dehydrogenase [Chlamydiae bacterium RIFCSPHIGHO2_12_FULL_49_11]|nr:MAG: glutamate dehydrogenase [Chlamydiae bacterium RIFCSPHIGHO2_12_FULL_49_11]